jgi:glycosyltransferase involved in cell wall biosynthesis
MDFDIVFFLQDSFILKDVIPRVVQEMRNKGKKFRSVVYFPIDGEPWEEWVEAMYAADVSVTYTEWARRQCVGKYPAIKDKLQVIPHGISLKEFFPHPPEKRQQLRKLFFGPHADKVIVLNVNRNQQRKDIPRSLMAFKEFKKECPNSVYYLHCAVKDVGWDLERVVKNMKMRLDEDVLFPKNFNVNTGFPVSVVNDLYNCADVCISTTLGGGWELSSVESGATKVPCIFPDNTALTEIFADGRGFLCRSGDTNNFKVVLPMDNEIVRPLVNITDMVKYLKRLYDKPEIGHVMADKFYKWIVENLQWEKHVVPRFDTIFRDLFADLTKPEQAIESSIVQNVEEKSWQVGMVL